MGGTAATRFAISCRDSGVENSDTMAWLTPIRNRPIRPPTSRVARRMSRMVFPKTDPQAVDPAEEPGPMEAAGGAALRQSCQLPGPPCGRTRRGTFLERRLAADEVQELVLHRFLDDGGDLARTRGTGDVVV